MEREKANCLWGGSGVLAKMPQLYWDPRPVVLSPVFKHFWKTKKGGCGYDLAGQDVPENRRHGRKDSELL